MAGSGVSQGSTASYYNSFPHTTIATISIVPCFPPIFSKVSTKASSGAGRATPSFTIILRQLGSITEGTRIGCYSSFAAS